DVTDQKEVAFIHTLLLVQVLYLTNKRVSSRTAELSCVAVQKTFQHENSLGWQRQFERLLRPHNYVLLGLSFSRIRLRPKAIASATTNAGTAVMIGQIASANKSKR